MANPRQGDFATRKNVKPQRRFRTDHWSFWREGFPALMATDTAPLRYPYYHTRADTPDKVNFGWLSQIVSGFRAVIADVATPR